jgi:hypothetical protein
METEFTNRGGPENEAANEDCAESAERNPNFSLLLPCQWCIKEQMIKGTYKSHIEIVG